ncbi:hypothetical protein [Aeromicrobium sp. CTD01-1L150]|uniref:hypothetical protein n=1 Tax=Aeromicrobium sp. CTD01-1L150 TaxID=3341830 RepID=UPI0035C16D96
MPVRLTVAACLVVPTLVLAACGPAPDRVHPERARLATDDLARTTLVATGAALRLPTEDLRGGADARRCEDRATARHQVDATFDVEVRNVAVATDDLVRELRRAGLETERSRDGERRVVSGSVGSRTYEVTVGSQEQTLTVRSECLDVGRVQAVEISFAERYSVRPGEPSPDR